MFCFLTDQCKTEEDEASTDHPREAGPHWKNVKMSSRKGKDCLKDEDDLKLKLEFVLD